MKFHKLSENATTPSRGSDYAAGLDLYSAEEKIVPAKGRALIKTDIQVSIAFSSKVLIIFRLRFPMAAMAESPHDLVSPTKRELMSAQESLTRTIEETLASFSLTLGKKSSR